MLVCTATNRGGLILNVSTPDDTSHGMNFARAQQVLPALADQGRLCASDSKSYVLNICVPEDCRRAQCEIVGGDWRIMRQN